MSALVPFSDADSTGGNSVAGAPHALGEALADLTFRWSDWVHRRVDSIQPLEGERGRRRHSVDCTPPPDERLAYGWNDHARDLVIPLMWVRKGPLRHFDAKRADGYAMPVLGTDETTYCAVAMVRYLLHVDKVPVTEAFAAALAEIAGAGITDAHIEMVETLLTHGTWRGERCVDPAVLSSSVKKFVRVISSKFLLTGLLPSADAGRRQVIKFSYHWRVEDAALALTDVAVAAGFRERVLEIPLDAPHAARSYHLEFHAPPELEVVAVAMPERREHAGGTDASAMPVAHAYARYADEPSGDASVSLGVPFAGLRRTALIASGFSTLVMLCALLLPDAKHVWRTEPDGPATALLAAPALLFTFLATRRESALLRRSRDLLRLFVGVAGVSLFIVAASLIGHLVDPWLDVVWWTVVAVNGAIALLLAVPPLQRRGRVR